MRKRELESGVIEPKKETRLMVVVGKNLRPEDSDIIGKHVNNWWNNGGTMVMGDVVERIEMVNDDGSVVQIYRRDQTQNDDHN